MYRAVRPHLHWRKLLAANSSRVHLRKWLFTLPWANLTRESVYVTKKHCIFCHISIFLLTFHQSKDFQSIKSCSIVLTAGEAQEQTGVSMDKLNWECFYYADTADRPKCRRVWINDLSLIGRQQGNFSNLYQELRGDEKMFMQKTIKKATPLQKNDSRPMPSGGHCECRSCHFRYNFHLSSINK